eukprot:jgi/Mesen1/8211/ME000442S07483
MSMFVRVKRMKTTYFVHCEPSESALELKQKVEALTEHPVEEQRLIVLPSETVLDDSKTLADQKVENDAVIALVFPDGSGGWENVQIDSLADPGSVNEAGGC